MWVSPFNPRIYHGGNGILKLVVVESGAKVRKRVGKEGMLPKEWHKNHSPARWLILYICQKPIKPRGLQCMKYSFSLFRLLLLLGCLSFVGCATSRAKKLRRWYRSDHPAFYQGQEPQNSLEAKLHYLGCGGFLLEYAGEALLIDPYFSNVGMMDALTREIKSDTALINEFFQARLGGVRDTAGNIKTVLISHAHHDHLADVPALLQNNLLPGKTTVYASNTAVNLLRSFPSLVPDTARQLVDLEKQFSVLPANPKLKSQPEASPFFYSPGRRFRFSAIPSDHAGHYFFIKGQKLPGTEGSVKHPRKKQPNRVLHFKEGQNFNFLIDLLDESGKPVFRIFSNAGAACDAGVGFPPEHSCKEKPIDLLLMCGANYNIAENYPRALLEYLCPKTVFVAHWENFFKPIRKLQKRPEVVPNTNIPKLMDWLEKFSKTKGFPEQIYLEQPLRRVLMLKF